MKKIPVFLLSCAASLFSLFSTADACTDFRVISKDGTLVVGRSMEFAVDMNANIRSSNRTRQFDNTAPDGKPAMSWKAKYGYLYIDGMNQDIVVDGINENGLSFEYLYLPGETQYQTIPEGKDAQAIPYYHFGDWVLGNFKSVDEVRQALANIHVYQQTMPALGNVIFPLHAAIQDSTGKGIVVEFVQGQMKVYDYMGVLTNSPTYDWQVTNLRNYLNLSPYSPKPVVADGESYSSTGMGAGMVGLPGDVSPPSRFAKIAFMLNSVYPVQNAGDALNLAQHIMNNVDIPAGIARSVDQGKESSDITQWVVFKDLTHKIIYYRTYNDMTLRGVSMSKVDLSEKAPLLKMPLAQPPYIMDMTDKFMSGK